MASQVLHEGVVAKGFLCNLRCSIARVEIGNEVAVESPANFVLSEYIKQDLLNDVRNYKSRL